MTETVLNRYFLAKFLGKIFLQRKTLHKEIFFSNVKQNYHIIVSFLFKKSCEAWDICGSTPYVNEIEQRTNIESLTRRLRLVKNS